MKRLKMTSGNNPRKFKLLFFDEKVAAINLLVSVVCLLLMFVYVFMRSNFSSVDITALRKTVKTVLLLCLSIAIFFLFSWAWISERIHRFAIQKRIRGIIVANNVINCLVLFFAEMLNIDEVLD